MPMPAGLHAQAVSVDRPSRRFPSCGIDSASARRQLAAGALAGCLVLVGPLLAQSPSADDLEAASRGRTIAVGSPATRHAVARLPLEVYVARVLAGEAEPNAPPGALEAHAVAIRSFTMANTGRHRRDGFDLCDTTHCQVLRSSTPATRAAARATAGEVLTLGGQLVEVVYSASCGGRSENASALWSGRSFPYLRSVEDDVHGDDEPWTMRTTLEQLRHLLVRNGFTGARLTDVSVESRTDSERVARLRVTGLQPAMVSGEQFRAIVGPTVLRSTAFQVTREGAALRFTGRGYGHGVGMCVIGAGRRARRGEDATAILAHYYPGLERQSLDVVARPGVSGARPERPSGPASTVSAPAGSAASTPVSTATGPIAVRVPLASPLGAGDLQRMATRTFEALSASLGTSVPGAVVELHGTIDSFRSATKQPWWISSVVRGTTVDLAPAAVLAQRMGVEYALRAAMAELFVAPALQGRPAWVRVGAARYFAREKPPATPSARVRCPSDEELLASTSAPGFREAEARAEMCFAAGYARTKDWRTVR
jgi:SpoIID/LytB domain protein